MIATLSHRAEILAMNLTIEVLRQTRRHDHLREFVGEYIRITQGKPVMLWVGALVATCIAGFLTGYIGYFSLPR